MVKYFLVVILLIAFGNIYAQAVPDTLDIGGATIIRDSDSTIPQPPKKTFFKKLNTVINPKNLRTAYLNMDVGFSLFNDRTDYASAAMQQFAPGSRSGWFRTQSGRSHHFALWLITQNINLVRHIVNAEYSAGLSFNNYRFSGPVVFYNAAGNAPTAGLDPAAVATPATRTYSKSKLSAHYLTVPFALTFNLTPRRLYNFEVSTGLSVGYLIASKYKSITSDGGKARLKDDFGLRPWRVAYTTSFTLGVVTLYGSYGLQSMFRSGADFVPYNVGIRLKPMALFGRIQER